MNPRRAWALGLIVLPVWAALFAGCDKDDSIQRYEIAKTSDDSPSNDTAATPAAAPQAEAAAPIHWTVPAGWKQLPGNDMRYCSFAVSADHPDLQLTVVPLAGSAGGLLSNINRWEGQIGLPPSQQDDLKKLVTRIDVAGTPVDVFDRTGPQNADHSPGKRILAAIIAHGDQTWFLKLSGASDLVQSQKANFDSFIRSIRFDVPQDSSAVADSAAAPANAALPIAFTIPSGWQQETPSQVSAFRVVAFEIASGTDSAEAVVTHVAKDSGTMLDNINRWRGQVELPPVDDPASAGPQKLDLPAGQATVWDFDNGAAGRRMILAMITHGSQWWVFKLIGPSSIVADQKSNFNSFLTSVQFQDNAGG